jgi:hypothetical protein
MKNYMIKLSSETSFFYTEIAKNVGLPVEHVMADALFKLAGELSLNALHSKKIKNDRKT